MGKDASDTEMVYYRVEVLKQKLWHHTSHGFLQLSGFSSMKTYHCTHVWSLAHGKYATPCQPWGLRYKSSTRGYDSLTGIQYF